MVGDNQEVAQADQAIQQSSGLRYQAPPESVVQQKLAWFTRQKIGLMVHWGIYSQIGVFESWPLVDEDTDWARVDCRWAGEGEQLREMYVGLSKSFNPVRFDPDEWADFALECGFRYFVFTTKHHDGFCMYDSQHTNYKITALDCPYHAHPRANIAKVLFDAFRARGIALMPYRAIPQVKVQIQYENTYQFSLDGLGLV